MTTDPLRVPPPPSAPNRAGFSLQTIPPDPDTLRDDAILFLRQFLVSQAPDRGPFQIQKGDNQQLPGISIPAWMMQGLSTLAGRPELPYNHDRATLHRDLIFMGLAAYVQVLSQWSQDPSIRHTTHIIRQEEQFRRGLHIQETLLNYTEDLSMLASVLDLKLRVGDHDAVYEELERTFHHLEQIEDRTFWRPTITSMVFALPEVQQALDTLGMSGRFAFDEDYQAWRTMQANLED